MMAASVDLRLKHRTGVAKRKYARISPCIDDSRVRADVAFQTQWPRCAALTATKRSGARQSSPAGADLVQRSIRAQALHYQVNEGARLLRGMLSFAVHDMYWQGWKFELAKQHLEAAVVQELGHLVGQ